MGGDTEAGNNLNWVGGAAQHVTRKGANTHSTGLRRAFETACRAKGSCHAPNNPVKAILLPSC